jgi:CPA1 family monovalent cation:H+ antiporter
MVGMQDPSALQALVLLGAGVVALTMVARRIKVAAPIVLLVGGVPLAFLPWLEDVRLRPEIVLLIFLPALLYWESLNTSLREIRANLRAVMIDSILLVLATAGAVAVAGHALGLSWPVAWVLGAVLAPTDATAVSAVARDMPRRQVTILRAESLVNDGTALVVFAIAVEVAVGHAQFGWPAALARFILSYLGGAAVGLLIAWLTVRVRRIAHDPLLEAAVNALSPFAAFLLAEEIHASGVLAVVVCGLTLSQVNPRSVAAQSRVRSRAFWQLATFLLNGALFVLVGLQLRDAVTNLASYSMIDAVFYALLISAVVIGTRLGWMYTVPFLITLVDRRPQHRLHRLRARHRLPIAWSGFRGAVSLAAALAIPETMADGSPFPARDLIILITFGVILVTLLCQGLTLSAVLRWARLPADRSELDELRLAERTVTEAGMAALPAAAARLDAPAEIVDRIRDDLEQRLADIADPADEAIGEPAPATATGHSPREHYRLLRSALLPDKRAALVGLRDSRLIDDIVLRRVQARLDAEEVRLSAAPDPE